MLKYYGNNYRWLIAALLFFATTINYADRQIIGLLKPVLEITFEWTETDFAHIVMAFTIAYAAGLLLMGRFIDKVGTKIGYSIIIIWWSIAGMLHAFAKNGLHFSIARIGLGLGEAGNFPAGIKTVSEWFPKKEKAVATGIFNSGTSVGVVFALLIVPFILRNYNWQAVFLITGALGFIWLVFWLIFYDLPSKQKCISKSELKLILNGHEKEPVGVDNDRIKWLSLFKFRQTWALIVGKWLIDPIFWFFLFWLPSYFSTTFKLDLTRPSLELMIIYTSTTIGSIAGGYLSSWLIRKGTPVLRARKTALLIFAILELTILMAQYTHSSWMVVGIISLAVAVHQAWATNVFTLASDLFPSESVSSMVGIAGMAGATGGILFPLFVGTLLDQYKMAGNLTGGYNLIFTVCGYTYLAAWFLIHLLTMNPAPHNYNSMQTFDSSNTI